MQNELSDLEFEDVLGYAVARSDLRALVAWVERQIGTREPSGCTYFACLNPHAVEMAARDASFRTALADADFLTPDGIGIVYASRILKGQIRRRVTGMDIFRGVSEALNRRGGSCFFLGSTERTLEGICEHMARDYPRIHVAGTLSPPFKPAFDADDSETMLAAVNGSGADVLWVGLTAPKQEKWVWEHKDRLGVAFAGPIGAAFDFYVGNVQRAGSAWQDAGLEWLPRLVQEPRRLWRRMLVSAPRFVARTLHHRFARR